MSEQPPTDESSEEHPHADARASSWFEEETRMEGDSDCSDNDENVTDLQPAGSELDPSFRVMFDPLVDRKPGAPPIRQFDKYELRDKIGEGGMGVVYKALDTKMDRLVALKLMRDRGENHQPVERERFIQEAKTAGSLGHANIVTVHSVGEHNDTLFIDMALIEGETLTSYVNRQRAQGMFSTKRLVAIALQIANGLKAAHDKGIIHRDIKPGNILIDQDGNVKIVDFGLARRSGGVHITSQNVTLGTPNFMSPEQAKGISELDERSDLFSFGAVLFFMCSGRFPFQAEDHMAVMYRVTHDPHQPLIELEPNLPKDLCSLVDRLLVKDCNQRVDSAAVVAADLMKVARQLEPIQPEVVNPTIVDSKPVEAKLSQSVNWLALIVVIGVVIAAFFVIPPRTNTAPLALSGLGQAPPVVVPDSSKISVGPVGDVPSITEALEQISAGGLITIVGNVADSNKVHLTSKHSGIKIIAEIDTEVPMLEIKACTNVLVENVTIRCESDQHGIRVEGDCSGLQFRKVRVEQSQEDVGRSAAAILLQEVKGSEEAPVVFDQCQIDCYKTGMTILAKSTNCRWIVIENSILTGDSQLDDGILILLEGNTEADTSVDLVTLSHNRFSNAATGIRLSYAMGAHVMYNTFLNIKARCVNVQLDSRTEKVVVERNLVLDGCPRLVDASLGSSKLEVNQNLATQIQYELGVHQENVEVLSEEPTHADYLLPAAFPEILEEWDVDYVGARPLRKNSPKPKSQQL